MTRGQDERIWAIQAESAHKPVKTRVSLTGGGGTSQMSLTE